MMIPKEPKPSNDEHKIDVKGSGENPPEVKKAKFLDKILLEDQDDMHNEQKRI